jgi:hypothetical protein
MGLKPETGLIDEVVAPSQAAPYRVNTIFGPGSVIASPASANGTIRLVTRSGWNLPQAMQAIASGNVALEWTRLVWKVRPL